MNSVIINILNKNSEKEINFLLQTANNLGFTSTLILVGENPPKINILPVKKTVFIQVESYDSINKKDITNKINEFINNEEIILFCANDTSNELANLLAIKLDKNILLNGYDIQFSNNKFIATKQIYSNNLYAEYDISNGIVLSLQYNNKTKIIRNNLVNLTEYDVYNSILADKQPFTLIATIPKEINKLKDASTVVLIGKGVRSDDIEKAKKLAKYLNAEVGATRPVTYLGLMPLSKMIGSSNISVSPNVLITLGVSGSAPLLTGIKNSKKIISVNKDKSAMIFNHSNIGIIADTNTFLTEYINKIEGNNDKI